MDICRHKKFQMKNYLAFLLLVLAFASCSKKEADLMVTGTIKGLKKGTVYLQQLKDSSLVVLDSMEINGEHPFVLKSDLEEPEVLLLMLDKHSSEESRIAFFADKGITEINTTLKDFPYKHTIKGSSQQEKYAEFKKMISQFNNKNLDIVKAQLEAQVSGDTAEANAKTEEANNLLKRKYLYAINFAVNNKNSEVAPYIALAEIYDANMKYLDTIFKVLPNHIANSKYGKELDKFIKQRKLEEK
jgi:outer membrane PBP1 activator LpoA protein